MKKIAKAKAGTSLGMKSVKAGYDSNPSVTRADIISAGKMNAGKAKYGAKVAPKKRIKKAQGGTKMVVDDKEYMEGAMLPEAVVTASRITDEPSKVKSSSGGSGRAYKSKPAKRSVQSVKNFRKTGSGPGSGLEKLKQRITRRYKEGGEVEMAKKGASVKSSGMHKMPDGSMMKNSKMKLGGSVKAKAPMKKMMSGGKCKMGC